MRRLLVLVAFLGSCGDEKQAKENPTNCALKEVGNGTEFTCTDKDGNVTVGVVKNGEKGAQGEPGAQGPAGENGKGLALKSALVCKGEVEGWMENSSYAIAFRSSQFETGDTFASSEVKLMRDGEVINVRNSSAFYMSPESVVLNDGQFSMVVVNGELSVKSRGGMDVKLKCEEVK